MAASLARPGVAPPGADDWSCRGAKHPRPVVLLHGTHVNMAINWNALSPLLKNDGYCVFALNYGGLKLGQSAAPATFPPPPVNWPVSSTASCARPAPPRSIWSATRRAAPSPSTT
ncbi:esterase/lipase family protein [Streptomyces sp. NPDC003032]